MRFGFMKRTDDVLMSGTRIKWGEPHFCQCQWKILGANQAIFMQIF